MIELVWRPQKKRRNPGCAFLAFGFQRTSPSSVRRRLAASLVLEFHRRESGCSSPNRRCHRGCTAARWMSGWLRPPLHKETNRKFQQGKKLAPQPPCSLSAVKFPHNLLDRPACRQAPLNRLLQALLLQLEQLPRGERTAEARRDQRDDGRSR